MLLGEEVEPTLLVMDVKTGQGEPDDYGSIELHYTDILTDSCTYYKDGKQAVDNCITYLYDPPYAFQLIIYQLYLYRSNVQRA